MRKRFGFLLLLLGFVVGVLCVKAQGTGPVVITSLAGTAGPGGCGPVAAAGNGELCLASNGLYLSFNGSAWTVVSTGTAPVAGVTSWNGQTGAVIYTPPAPPVTSVNGKTGAVTLAASTTLQ